MWRAGKNLCRLLYYVPFTDYGKNTCTFPNFKKKEGKGESNENKGKYGGMYIQKRFCLSLTFRFNSTSSLFQVH